MYLLISIIVIILLLLILCGNNKDNFTQNLSKCKRNISCDLFLDSNIGEKHSCITNDKEEGVCRGGFCCT
jgi:hypothetical protein